MTDCGLGEVGVQSNLDRDNLEPLPISEEDFLDSARQQENSKKCWQTEKSAFSVDVAPCEPERISVYIPEHAISNHYRTNAEIEVWRCKNPSSCDLCASVFLEEYTGKRVVCPCNNAASGTQIKMEVTNYNTQFFCDIQIMGYC